MEKVIAASRTPPPNISHIGWICAFRLFQLSFSCLNLPLLQLHEKCNSPLSTVSFTQFQVIYKPWLEQPSCNCHDNNQNKKLKWRQSKHRGQEKEIHLCLRGCTFVKAKGPRARKWKWPAFTLMTVLSHLRLPFIVAEQWVCLGGLSDWKVRQSMPLTSCFRVCLTTCCSRFQG